MKGIEIQDISHTLFRFIYKRATWFTQFVHISLKDHVFLLVNVNKPEKTLGIMILILIKNNIHLTITIELNGMSMPFSEESCKQQVAEINPRCSKKIPTAFAVFYIIEIVCSKYFSASCWPILAS